MKHFRILTCCAFIFLTFASHIAPLDAQKNADDLPHHIYLPLVYSNGCGNIPGETYGALTVNPPPTDRPAEQHADLNLALRGYITTTGTLGLVDYSGPTDPKSPRLYSLFADNRVPDFSSVSQVYNWNWDTNSRADPITDPPVTLLGMTVAPDEILHVPQSGYNIGTLHSIPPRGFFTDGPEGSGTNYEVLVLYASAQRITLKYTRDDNVIHGYTLHVENVCVAPDLLAEYAALNASGRVQLPALKAGQGFGRALNTEIGVVTRDTGTFLDPRSHKDWW